MRRAFKQGYTLIELTIVVLLLGLIAAMGVPRLLPLLAFGALEGSARHLRAYGRAAQAHSALTQERIVVLLDLDEQAYWTVKYYTEEEAKLLFGEEEFLEEEEELPEDEQIDLVSLSNIEEMDETAIETHAEKMAEKFDLFARQAVEARARNIKQDEGILSDMSGPLFEEEFGLDESDEEEREVIGGVLLERTKLPEGVRIDSVEMDGETTSKGVVEIEFAPLGLLEKATIFIKNENDEYYSVLWDPFGEFLFSEGKEDFSA
jgi:prepilin-type N-terminal cleavage/methylation domain-containing protein